jgi:hypothetical protein
MASLRARMHRVGPDLVFSATDLAHYAGCAQRTWLDRLKALGLDEPERFGPIAKEERSPEGYRGTTVGRCPA